MDPQAPSSPNPTPTTNPTPPAAAAQPAPKPEEQIPGVPASWEGAFKIYKHSKAAVMHNLKSIVLIWVVVVIIAVLLDTLFDRVGQIIGEIIGTIGGAAVAMVYLAGIRRQTLEAVDAVKATAPLILQIILFDILLFLACFVSIILLVIPFFFVFPRLILGTYYIVDKKMGAMDAFKASWATTKGHIGKVYGIIGASLVMLLPAFTIIGLPVAIYFLFMFGAATAILYEFLSKQQPAAPAPAPAATTPTTPTPAPTV